MTIISSGNLAITAIAAEFGGTGNLAIQNYYAGGSFVASGTANGTGHAIPSSGNIAFSDFYGASAFVAHSNTFNTHQSSSITIPAGATTLVVEIWAATGVGGAGLGTTLPNVSRGGGGGGGGYSRSSLSVSGHGGQTINFTVGTGAAIGGTSTGSSISSGTFSITTMTANPGNNGGNAPNNTTAGTPGTGGTASGGNVANTTGNSGVGATGATPVTGVNGTGTNGGTGGTGAANTGRGAGQDGVVVFRWT